jgi:hypothetical protein
MQKAFPQIADLDAWSSNLLLLVEPQQLTSPAPTGRSEMGQHRKSTVRSVLVAVYKEFRGDRHEVQAGTRTLTTAASNSHLASEIGTAVSNNIIGLITP